MRTELFWFLSFGGFAAMSLLCGILVWPQLVAAWPSIEEAIDRFRRLPPFAKLVLLLFVGAFVVYGSTKTNQADQVKGEGEGEQWNLPTCSAGQSEQESGLLCSPSPFTFTSNPPAVTPEDIARGWQLWEVRTNCNISYTMPENATLATNWWVRGAYEDVNPFDFGSWRFPFGSNSYKSAWAFSWGKVRFALGNTNTEIVAVGAPMSAVPYRSRLWSAADTNDSRFITWENFALNRDTNTPVNAQIELRTTGDFVTRSNDVETVYRRVDPEDWDDDGWRNDDDPDPYVWEEYWDSFWQELPEGANESAYCWIEVRPRWHSYIEFVGDGPSNLDDPYLWAKAGETYRVLLLIGKSYTIFSSQPVDVVGRSSSSIEIDGNGSTEIEVVWPVTFSALESNGRGFRMVIRPSSLGGLFHWTDSCCTIYGTGLVYRYGCDGDCGCSGCYAQGHYEYEGYRLSATGGWCGCSSDHGVDHDPQSDPYSVGASISFTKQAIIFEDEYANTTNDIVPWRSTETELVCSAYAGGNGGFVRFDISGDDGLIQYTGRSLPYVRNLAPNERICFTNRYRAVSASSREDEIEATSYFSENVTGWTENGETYATAVKVEIRPLVDAPQNKCVNRHRLGVRELLVCDCTPESAEITLGSSSGEVLAGRRYQCPFFAAENPLTVSCGNATYLPWISVVEPSGIETRNPRPVTYGVKPGRAGWVGLRQNYYVLPLDVSFTGISIEEVPCTRGSRSGYFDSPGFDVISCHSWDMGAGRWLRIGPDNKAGLGDTAAITMELMRVNAAGEFTEDTNCCWTAGWVTWDIPFGWGPTNNVGNTEVIPPLGQFNPNAGHSFEINSAGDVTVRKFGNSAERLITGQLKLNGEIWGTH